jgi:hypothetical protein
MKPIWIKLIGLIIAGLVLATISTCRQQQHARAVTSTWQEK